MGISMASWRLNPIPQPNPAEITVTIRSLVLGREYQVQLIGSADGRTSCAERTYEPHGWAGQRQYKCQNGP